MSAGSVLSGGCEAGHSPDPSLLLGLCWPSLVSAHSWTIPIHLHVVVSCFHACLQVSSLKGQQTFWGRASQAVLVVNNPPARAGDVTAVGSIPGSGRSPGRGHGNTPVFLLEESHGQRRLAGYSPWGRKESDTTEVTWRTRLHFGLAPTFLPYLNLITSVKMVDPNKVTFTGTEEQNFIV